MQLSVIRPFLLASVLALATGQPGESQSAAEVLTEEQRTHLQTLIAALRNDSTYVPGELLVKFKAGSTPEQRTGALRVLRSSVTPETSDWIGDILHVRGLVDEDPERAAMVLARQPEIAFAEPNYVSHLHNVPNDPGFPSQWHMELINMPTA